MPKKKTAQTDPTKKRLASKINVSSSIKNESVERDDDEPVSTSITEPLPPRGPLLRILMVADGIIDFGECNHGLSELINKGLLPMNSVNLRVVITTAHRRLMRNDDCDDGRITADILDFRFTNPLPPSNRPLDIRDYDQLWLFGFEKTYYDIGYSSETLPPQELAVIFKFMQDGGGVFATGDHEDIGGALCGAIPRVKSMRLWDFVDASPPPMSPPVGGPHRHDTLRWGIDRSFHPTVQSDRIPQTIIPRFYKATPLSPEYPHPLLVNGDGVIDILPDHMHEGEVAVPTDLTAPVVLPDIPPSEEYPRLPSQQTRLAPEIIAMSFPDPLNSTVIPRCFKTICAYDGHRVGVGRVVAQSTWHHFININLRGTRPEEWPYTSLKIGFYTQENITAPKVPTPEYEIIKQYFRNIVKWLSSAQKNTRLYSALLDELKSASPIVEEVWPNPNPSWDDIFLAGESVRKLISDVYSPAEALTCALALTGTLSQEIQYTIKTLIDPWGPSSLRNEKKNVLFDPRIGTDAVLGGAIIQLVTERSAGFSKAGATTDDALTRSNELEAIVTRGVNLGVNSLAQMIEESNGDLQNLSSILKEHGKES